MSQLLTNKDKLQEALNILQTKATPSGGIDTSDATATADKIFLNETAYVDGNKVTGSFTIDSEISEQENLVNLIAEELKGKAIGSFSNLQNKVITPSVDPQIVTADSGYDALGKVTVEGDSNLTNENIKSGVSIFGVSGTYEGSGGSSDTSMEDAFITRSISGVYTNDRVTNIGGYVFQSCKRLSTVFFPVCTNIGSYAFNGCNSLTTVFFPVCTNIGSYAFSDCNSLTTVSFPECTNIGSNVFAYCSSLTTVSFPECRYISTYAFAGCKRLTTVSFPVCSHIGSNVFAYCSSLTTVSFPVCTNIGSYAFNDCTSLTSVSFPECTNILDAAFKNCTSLTSVSFPVCRYISDYAFKNCTSLTSVSFPVCSYIGSSAFQSCFNLSQVYLMSSSVCTLAYSNAFSSTPYTGYSTYFSGTPYIYVPSSLVDAYKSATKWSYFSSYITGYDNSTITFTIEDVSYQAEEGMTWEEWVNSAYNTDGYYVNNSQLVDKEKGHCVVNSNDISQSSNDIIVNGEIYNVSLWMAPNEEGWV